jgi:hypothetical protein
MPNVSFELSPLNAEKFQREDLKPLNEKTEWNLLNGPKQVTRRKIPSPTNNGDPLYLKKIDAEQGDPQLYNFKQITSPK